MLFRFIYIVLRLRFCATKKQKSRKIVIFNKRNELFANTMGNVVVLLVEGVHRIDCALTLVSQQWMTLEMRNSRIAAAGAFNLNGTYAPHPYQPFPQSSSTSRSNHRSVCTPHTVMSVYSYVQFAALWRTGDGDDSRKNRALTRSEMEFMRVSVLCADNLLHRAFHFSIRSLICTEVFQYFSLEMWLVCVAERTN